MDDSMREESPCGKRQRFDDDLKLRPALALDHDMSFDFFLLLPAHRDGLYKGMERRLDFLARKRSLLEDKGLPSTVEDGLEFRLYPDMLTNHVGLLDKILQAARILFMDEDELYFVEAGDYGPFSPINELESLSAIYVALSSVLPGSFLDVPLTECRNEVSARICQLAEKNEYIYTDLQYYEQPDLSCNKLMRWLNSENMSSSLMIANVSEGGRGLIAAKDISIGEVVLEIPMSLVIHDQLPVSQTRGGDWDAKDFYSREIELMRLLVWIMEEKLNPHSNFSRYFEILPEEFKTGLYFSEDALKAAANTRIYHKINYLKECTKQQFDKLISKLDARFSFEKYKWAHALWFSHGIDAFLPDGKQKRCLVPFAGFFNHSLFPHVLRCEWGAESLKFIASRPCRKFEQCYLSYGNLSATELVPDYGFIPKGKNYYDTRCIDLSNYRYEDYDSKGALQWTTHVVRGQLGGDIVNGLPSALRKHLQSLFIATYEYLLPTEAEYDAIRILKDYLSVRLCLLKLIDEETEREKFGQNQEEPNWDIKLALEYRAIGKEIYICNISACDYVLKEIRSL